MLNNQNLNHLTKLQNDRLDRLLKEIIQPVLNGNADKEELIRAVRLIDDLRGDLDIIFQEVTAKNEDHYVTPQQAAKLIGNGLSARTISRKFDNDEFPGIMAGSKRKIHKEGFLNWVRQYQSNGEEARVLVR